MRTLLLCFACTCFLTGAGLAQAEPGSELDALRAELEQMRSDYEARIAELERRLDDAERQAAAQQAATAPEPADDWLTAPQPDQSATGGSGLFNPDLGVVFRGLAWSYDNDPDDYEIPGFPLAGEAGPAPEGLSLGETEISISAAVDDKFTARLTMPVHYHDGETEVEIEEAWVETLKLPAGLSLRMGRFFSNIGYLNTKHAHSWDFTDQPLPYQALLGNQYLDDGLQLRWLAPTDFYLEFGGEVMRGERYPGGSESHDGVGGYTLNVRTGGDVGYDHSWQAGLSYLAAEAEERGLGHAHGGHEEEHGDEGDHEEEEGHADGPMTFTGDSDVLIADFVWKWAPNGNWKQRNFIFQAEYIWRNEDGFYTMPDEDVFAWDVAQRGWYAQAVYQPFPQWRFGMRYDRLIADDPGAAYEDTMLMPGAGDPWRYSVMADWSNSEFSRVRLQYTQDETGPDDDRQLGLQYIFSIGAHGAHTF